jgi:carbamate kinase
MLVVVALGGNALLRRGDAPEADVQRANVRVAAGALVDVARDAALVVTHGNGPQVGLLALQSAALAGVAPFPLDVLGAETEGMIGYVLAQEIANALPGRRIVTILTQVVVDPADPAFGRPEKPIGPVYPEERARAVAAATGWMMARDGSGWRRVVPSPEPLDLVERTAIEILVRNDVLVVCAGGGGIPVVTDAAGALHGVEAVVDKDLSAALLARRLGADLLLLLTDVAAVEDGWGTPRARPIARATPATMRAGRFAPGSMGPKVEAACRFVEATGGVAAIGSLHDAARVARGEAGTRIELSARA